eukprot:12880175-Prorocentrum_lima.AAC.1
MQRTYPFRIWQRDVNLWDLSTSVEADRRGPLLISQLRSTANMFMQEEMDRDDETAALFQRGGRCIYDGSVDLT